MVTTPIKNNGPSLGGLRFWGLKKKYLGAKIDIKLTYLGSEILRAEKKKIFVNELGSLERNVFLNTIVNKTQFFLKNWST